MLRLKSKPDMISIHALLAESDNQNCDNRGAKNHFYPRSPCGERQLFCWIRCPPQTISIHALLAESDRLHPPAPRERADFYPRSPCGERHLGLLIKEGTNDFYPRSPCGERRRSPQATVSTWQFLSTLSLRRATCVIELIECGLVFLSTLSLRRATNDAINGCNPDFISIHALLAESDPGCVSFFLMYHYFYPRSPCGERRRKPNP